MCVLYVGILCVCCISYEMNHNWGLISLGYLIDNIDLDGLGSSNLSTSELDKFNKVNSVRSRLGVLGNSPFLGVNNILVVLGSNRAALVDGTDLLLLLVTGSAVKVDIQLQCSAHGSLLINKRLHGVFNLELLTSSVVLTILGFNDFHKVQLRVNTSKSSLNKCKNKHG